MTQFKVGDRVRLAENYNSALRTGAEGEVERIESRMSDVDGPLLHVKGWKYGGIYAFRFNLAEPRKDTPKVGDTVRVVLEGKVSAPVDGGFGISARAGNPGDNYIVPDHDHVKSVEIIAPPKPSVKDLPAWAVVKNKDTGEVLQRQAATDVWYMMSDNNTYASFEIDRINWVLLVPKDTE